MFSSFADVTRLQQILYIDLIEGLVHGSSAKCSFGFLLFSVKLYFRNLTHSLWLKVIIIMPSLTLIC
jgi:hypothetical protein